jgi:hypothetical protein
MANHRYRGRFGEMSGLGICGMGREGYEGRFSPEADTAILLPCSNSFDAFDPGTIVAGVGSHSKS